MSRRLVKLTPVDPDPADDQDQAAAGDSSSSGAVTAGDPDTGEQASLAAVPDTSRQTTPKASRSPRKKGSGTAAPKAKKTAQKATQPAATTPPADTGGELRALGADVADAKRFSGYLHPDDYKALALAKIEDGADLNARIRAMIAVWRHDKRVAAKVDRIARKAPRGSRERAT